MNFFGLKKLLSTRHLPRAWVTRLITFGKSTTPEPPCVWEAWSPHCDQSVLHAPGECRYCDEFPIWQSYREHALINFTGHYDLNKARCPSEQKRSLERIYRWPGNTPNGT